MTKLTQSELAVTVAPPRPWYRRRSAQLALALCSLAALAAASWCFFTASDSAPYPCPACGMG